MFKLIGYYFVIYLDFHVLAFWLEIVYSGLKFDVSGTRKDQIWKLHILIPIGTPYVIPRQLSRYTSKFVKGSDLYACLRKMKNLKSQNVYT